MDLSAVELLDTVGVERAARAYVGTTRFVWGRPKGILLVKWSETEEKLDERFARLDEIGASVGAQEAVALRMQEEQAQTVKLRKSILPLLLGTAERAKPVAFVEDAAMPPTGWKLESSITHTFPSAEVNTALRYLREKIENSIRVAVTIP